MAALPDQFTNRIIAAHGLWKFRLHEAIASGRSRFDPNVVERDDRCPFGQWLYGEGQQTHRHDERYETARQLHATFHRSAGEVLRLALDGRTADATTRMAPGQPFLDVSLQLVHHLDGWRKGDDSPSQTIDPLLCTTLETVAQSDAAKAAASVVSENVVAVAAATEQMTAAIREVAVSAQGASTIANDAVAESSLASATISRLNEAAAGITSVVNLISKIAEQTNLLALNATIEAARAGEYGKGFAVVASEVKELARATASATSDVEARIAAIRETASAAALSLAQFGERARTIADHQTTIASAVEEQSAATEEISRRIHEASDAAGEVVEIVSAVGLSARNTERTLSARVMA